MSLDTIILFALTELFLCLMPGPAVLLIISQGTLHGTRKGLAGIAGVLTGNFIFFFFQRLARVMRIDKELRQSFLLYPRQTRHLRLLACSFYPV